MRKLDERYMMIFIDEFFWVGNAEKFHSIRRIVFETFDIAFLLFNARGKK